MTAGEKDTVRQLREQGYGYKTISNIMGIPCETIKSHLKRHPCVICSASRSETWKLGTCKQCGEPLIQDPKRRPRLFCSDECRLTWWNQNKYREGGNPRTFKCLNCGKEFQAFVVKERKYCSHACYIEARFGRKPQPPREDSDKKTVPRISTDYAPKIMNPRQEIMYRLAKWVIKGLEEEQLLKPDEIEGIWKELLSFYAPPTVSVENVCGTMNGNGLGKYKKPSPPGTRAQKAGDPHA